MRGVSIVVLVAALTAFLLAVLGRRRQPSCHEIADTIERFLDGRGDPWEWDDFVSIPLRDPYLERIRIRCAYLDQEDPSSGDSYTGEEGVVVLRELVRELRSDASGRRL